MHKAYTAYNKPCGRHAGIAQSAPYECQPGLQSNPIPFVSVIIDNVFFKGLQIQTKIMQINLKLRNNGLMNYFPEPQNALAVLNSG